MSSDNKDRAPTSAGFPAIGNSRGARALAAAQQVAAQTRDEKREKLYNLLRQLNRFESDDFVWMACVDGTVYFSNGHDMHPDEGISLIELIKYYNSGILSWTAAPLGCDEWEEAELEEMKNAISQTVYELKSSNLPFVFAARTKRSDNLCFQFSHNEGNAAFDALTDIIAHTIIELSEELQRESNKRYFPEQYPEFSFGQL